MGTQASEAPPVTHHEMPSLSTLNSPMKWLVFGQSPNSATVTQLFRLMGVFEAKPAELSSAVISPAKDGEQELYRVGDKLPDGSQINRIEEHRVIIRQQDGQLVSILLDESAPPAGLNTTPPPQSPHRTAPVTPYLQGIPTQNGEIPHGLPNIQEIKKRMLRRS